MSELTQGRRAGIAMFALNGLFFGVWASRVSAVAQKFALTPGGLGLMLLLIGMGAIVSFPLAGRWRHGWRASRLPPARFSR